MKKSLIALVVLGTVAGAAQAASSVTLYGRADVGYQKVTGVSMTQGNILSLGTTIGSGSEGESRFGVKGSEDLGNGMAATFQLEGRFDMTTGAKSSGRTFFDRESTVGLKGSFGHVRVGRSLSAMENGIGFVDVGRRSADISPYMSAARHSNGLFYSYSAGAVTFGGDITTKGSYLEDGLTAATSVDGVSAGKSSYGVYGKYSANGLTVGAAYQADNHPTSKQKNEYGVGLSYAKGMFGAGASFAAGKTATLNKTRALQAYLAVNPTANDTIAAVYSKKRVKTPMSVVTGNVTVYGLEYVHALSKRTSVYANAARAKDAVANTTGNVYEVAVRHNF